MRRIVGFASAFLLVIVLALLLFPKLRGMLNPASPRVGGSAADAGASVAAASSPGPFEPLSPEYGGHVEDADIADLQSLFPDTGDQGQAGESGNSGIGVTRFVDALTYSFFGLEPVLLSGFTVSHAWKAPGKDNCGPTDVMIWISMTSPTEGFTKVAQRRLPADGTEITVSFPPAEARFVRLVIVANVEVRSRLCVGSLRAIEAERPGYRSLLKRHPELGTLAAGGMPFPEVPAGKPVSIQERVGGLDPAEACLPDRHVEPPGQGESRNVLVITNDALSEYPPFSYHGDADLSGDDPLYSRIRMTIVAPSAARPVLLLPEEGVDTVVLAQVCDIQASVSAQFKTALVRWVGAGHKLIIQDSDHCGGRRAIPPDYSFLPYRLATNNPGARGAPSDTLIVLEQTALANTRAGAPGFLDLDGWTHGETHDEVVHSLSEGGDNDDRLVNELGDSNVITQYDPHWCGYLLSRNVNNEDGFVAAYAHYGRGLIIYDGVDIDQIGNASYHELVTRELAHPFNPDGLPCTTRVTDFVLTTEERLKSQRLVPGRTYTYPLTVISNMGHTGTLALSLASAPSDPGLSAQFSPEKVTLGASATSELVVTTTEAALSETHALAVVATPAGGGHAVLCLSLEHRQSGAIQVVSDLPSRQPSRSLEIVLDFSGSMNLSLERSTRIATARKVLRGVLEKLPSDINVGVRLYGHRYGPRQAETCTDSELVIPMQPLDREQILSVVDRIRPRGETPLIYSILQTIPDLEGLASPSILVITDGEESCGGDARDAAAQLQASGIHATLNIVGFTVKGKEVEATLAGLAESTGGRYYGAQNGEALTRAILIAAIDKMPYSVFDREGRVVAKGIVGSTRQELAFGEYKVVVEAPGGDLVAERVVIDDEGDALLRVTLEGDRLVLKNDREGS